MSSQPAVAFDMQMDLARWMATDGGEKMVAHYFMSLYTGKFSTKRIDLLRKGRETAKLFTSMENSLLIKAQSYWVSSNVAEVLLGASEKRESQALKPEDLPTPNGFVVFQQPIWVPDVLGVLNALQAIHWSPGTIGDLGRFYEGAHTTGLRVVLYTSTRASGDEFADWMMRDGWPEGIEPSPLMIYHLSPWQFGRPLNDDNVVWEEQELFGGYEDMEEIRRKTLEQHEMLGKPLQTFWDFVQQTVVLTHSIQPSRQQRRRIRRLGLLTDEEKDIKVVTLRRRKEASQEYEGEGSTGSEVNWSHRWISSGHWRWQPYKVGYGESHRCTHCGDAGVEHKQIWIRESIKGPEDKPLVHKNVVFKVSR